MRQRGLLAGALACALLIAGPMPWANAAPVVAEAPAAPSVPEAPVVPSRAAVTPTIASIPAQAVISAQSTTQGAQTVLASIPARDTSTFDLVGATWTASTGAVTLQVQTKSATGWSDWTNLADEAPSSDAPTSVADPLFVGDSTGIAVRALGGPGASISGLTAKTVTSTAVAADSQLATVSAQASVVLTGAPQPSIVSRAGWGADESIRTSCSNGTYDSTIKAAVIHHTAGTNDYTAAQSASIVRGIYAYHVQANGWCDIGYNFLVDKFGTIFEGRWGGIDKPVHGAHATSWNTDTMGVSFMMNSDTLAVPDAALSAGVSLLAWKLGGYYREPLGTTTLVGATQPVIFGHGDVMATDCPGTNLRARMQDIRNQTYNALYWVWKTPLYNLYAGLGGDSSNLGSVKDLERPVGSGREVTFQNGGGYQNPAGQTFWLGAGLDALYQGQGGPTGSLGWPTSSQVAVDGGYMATFTNGTLLFPQSSPSSSFVKASYQDFLGRAPSQTELNTQVLSLVTNKVSKSSYLNTLATSDEWLTTIVTKMYKDTLNRAPDAAGLAGWVGVLRAGTWSVADVASYFYASDEYYKNLGGNSATTWVTQLYKSLLGRAPDAPGLAQWVQQTNDPRYGRVWVARMFYQSTESRQLRVKNLYQALLQRDPDPTGWPYWTETLFTTGDISLAVSLAFSKEYFDKAQTRFPS